MIFSVTYYPELPNATSTYYTFHIYLQMLNWLFGHYRTLTTLLGKTIFQ